MINEKLEELPALMTVREVAQVLGVEDKIVDEIICRENFTVIMLKSRRRKIIKKELINWLQNAGKYRLAGE
ncbi:hypothetical protein [Clostridium sp. JN-1]|uniref:hypothetical protein n=1 Tax=Clostridium sp. JN-1 TaxID=2483110 RepID=UPI000F0B0AE9|nr:hypothetical protein [Clostridium sp. JN-1]